MSVTVATVIAMPVLAHANPVVAAAERHLDRPVRWVHAAELADIAPLLRGGDLLLSTGIALPDTAVELQAYAASLAASGAAGLMIELGRRWQELPAALVAGCETAGLPLIALTRELRFASVTQAVGERIVDAQVTELREAQRVHDTFTDLSIDEAGPQEILEAVQRLSGAAVLLENAHHQVLDYRAGPEDIGPVVERWATTSAAIEVEGRSGWHRDGWLVAGLGRRDRRWGRLVLHSPDPPTDRLVAVAERAAAAVAMHLLQDRHRAGLVRRTHHELLLGLVTGDPDPDLLRRCELAGLRIAGRVFVGLTVRPRGDGGRPGAPADDVIATAVHAAHELRVDALASDMDGDVRVLLSLPHPRGVDGTVDAFAERLHRRHRVLIGCGRTAARAAELPRTLREARHVADSVRSVAPDTVVHRLEDVHLRGLLALLGEDDRLRLFVSRELGPLREYDARTGADLVATIAALLDHPGSKTAAAAARHVSRPVFYDRLAKAEQVLGASLDDPHIRVSLQVALLADELAVEVESSSRSLLTRPS